MELADSICIRTFGTGRSSHWMTRRYSSTAKAASMRGSPSILSRSSDATLPHRCNGAIRAVILHKASHDTPWRGRSSGPQNYGCALEPIRGSDNQGIQVRNGLSPTRIINSHRKLRLGEKVGTSRRIGFNPFIVSLGLFLGGLGSSLADPTAGAAGTAPASDSTSDAPKSLPQISIFSSVHQSFKTNPELLVVRGHFDLGSPPDVLRYYCVINTKTGKREPLAVRADLAPHAGGMTGVKNVAVSLYACADAEQQGLLV